ncbi:hypothetical protein LEP1GSC133_5000 [Leptospira borgpetersenii serovar Pomona str. 200901868]|uniref:Uncharacterized protein n=1 Tax=Leptospira borgpetersenii serovar Pomona str. 200901868 TaxID=1192866 RepID=M6WKB3_LEPBO|nr:hypothetical protein LEP1GSC133_5000 [Leptospira borgpetersenii serovar Pomona str. 200901868]
MSAFLKKINIPTFETNLEPAQNLRNVRATTILNDGRKPPMRRLLIMVFFSCVRAGFGFYVSYHLAM